MQSEKARYNIRYMQCTIIWKIYIEKKNPGRICMVKLTQALFSKTLKYFPVSVQ